jgi:hypothetical protein
LSIAWLGVELFLVDIRSGEIYNEVRYSLEEGENGPYDSKLFSFQESRSFYQHCPDQSRITRLQRLGRNPSRVEKGAQKRLCDIGKSTGSIASPRMWKTYH